MPVSWNLPMVRLSCAICRSPWIFFFQAEDGIRDKLVTGVQTCALPIFPRNEVSFHPPLTFVAPVCSGPGGCVNSAWRRLRAQEERSSKGRFGFVALRRTAGKTEAQAAGERRRFREGTRTVGSLIVHTPIARNVEGRTSFRCGATGCLCYRLTRRIRKSVWHGSHIYSRASVAGPLRREPRLVALFAASYYQRKWRTPLYRGTGKSVPMRSGRSVVQVHLGSPVCNRCLTIFA